VFVLWLFADPVTFGERLIKMARWLMCSFRKGVVQRPRNVFSSGYCVNVKASPGRSSRINCGVKTSRTENSFQRQFTTHRNMPTDTA